IPRPFGVDEHRRPLAADAQAADLGAVAGPFATAQVLVLDLVLERFPRLQAVFGRAAVGAGAEQDVAPVRADAELGDRGVGLLVRVVGNDFSFSRPSSIPRTRAVPEAGVKGNWFLNFGDCSAA